MAGTYRQYEVTLGTRLLAVVSAENGQQVLDYLSVTILPEKPSVPILKINNGVVS